MKKKFEELSQNISKKEQEEILQKKEITMFQLKNTKCID
jgi:hypothetical protein